MKRNRILIAAAAATIALACLTIPAAAGEPEPELFLVEEDVVAPAMVAEYEAFATEVVAQFQAYDYPYPVYAHSTDDFRYLWVFPISGYCDIPKVFAAFEKVIAQWGPEKFAKAAQSADGSMDHMRFAVFRGRPDLSYAPAGNPQDEEKAPKFVLWGTCKVKPGHEAAAEASFRKFSALFKEHGVTWRWDTYMGEIGTESPVYTYVETGHSRGTFWTAADKIDEKIGKESMALWKEFMSHLRGYSYTTGTFRADLSYEPAPKEESAQK